MVEERRVLQWPVFVLVFLFSVLIIYVVIVSLPQQKTIQFEIKGYGDYTGREYNFLVSEELRCYLNKEVIMDKGKERAIRIAKQNETSVLYIFDVIDLGCEGCYDVVYKMDADSRLYWLAIRDYKVFNRRIIDEEFFPTIYIDSGNLENAEI